MSNKRENDFEEESAPKRVKFIFEAEKSDDESDTEVDKSTYTVLKCNDIEGAEYETSGLEKSTKMTAFNMKEEEEDGHFDTEGNFYWNKKSEIRDDWIDNIDWHQVAASENRPGYYLRSKKNLTKSFEIEKEKAETLAESSSSDSEDEGNKFNEIDTFKEILKIMSPKETIAKTLQRLGKSTKPMSSLERLKLKKQGLEPSNSGKIIATLTELCHKFTMYRNNLEIYQTTYEEICEKIKDHESKTKCETELDMYSENFQMEEKQHFQSKTNNEP